LQATAFAPISSTTHKERRRGQQSRHHDQVPLTNNCRG
jgi:hypothetical protein